MITDIETHPMDGRETMMDAGFSGSFYMYPMAEAIAYVSSQLLGLATHGMILAEPEASCSWRGAR